jgi:predicted AAA+ superfamily ATPase
MYFMEVQINPTATTNNYRIAIAQKLVDSIAAPVPSLTPRDTWLPVIHPHVSNKAVAVIGMRRAGKTSLLWQIIREQLAQGVPRESLVYFSFEDERLAGLEASDLGLLIEEYFKLYPQRREGQTTTFFLDEIQLVKGWEVFARRILDSENIQLYLSGSSAKLLSREIATSMRGRALEAVVTPFSFAETLRHHHALPNKKPEHFTKADRSQLHQHLMSYLAHGGFPEVQAYLAPKDARQRMDLLKTYVDVVLLRDVVERHNITQPQVLRWMVQQLLGNAAGSFSLNKFFNDLKSRGVSVGRERLYEYLDHLEDTFMLHSISIATDSERRRQVNPRKIYPVDTGLMALFDPSGKPNTGHALEVVVLHECLRRGDQLAYVRTASGYEVDFLAGHFDRSITLIQVCQDITDPKTRERELRALQEAKLEFPSAKCLLMTLEQPIGVAAPEGIEVVQAVDWLLT